MEGHAIIAEPLPRLMVQLALIIAVSRLLGLIATRHRQPMVVAEITAGVLLGPSLLGAIAPDTYDLIFAPDSLKELGLLSQLGLVLFMFLIGLELDPATLRGRTHASVAISHASIVTPFGLGWLLALALHHELSEPGIPSTSFGVFMGAAMSITAFPVLARILSERRLLHTKVGGLAIACAAIDDVTAWCILAFLAAISQSKRFDEAWLTCALAVVYVIVMLALVRPLLRRLVPRVSASQGLSQNVAAATLLVAIVSACVTELIGIHALFGAFLLGVILPKEGGFSRVLSEQLRELVLIVLTPLFFAYSGVRTQIGLLSTPADWANCALIIVVACLGKFGASTVVARYTGLSWREASALGILMNTRGLMELIVLNMGLDLGLIGPKVFTMMVLMALFTTIVATPLLQLVYPMEPSRERTVDGLPARSSAQG